jgi:hypothetical protein
LAKVSLKDQSTFAPFKGQRLRDPVLNNGRAYSRAAARCAHRDDDDEATTSWSREEDDDDEGNDDYACEPATELERLVARTNPERSVGFGGDHAPLPQMEWLALIPEVRAEERDQSTLFSRSPPLAAVSWCQFMERYGGSGGATTSGRGIFRPLTPVDYKVSSTPRPGLLLDRNGNLAVCESSGANKDDSGNSGGGAAALSIYSPSASSVSNALLFEDPDALMQATRNHYEALGVSDGECVDEAVVVVLDKSDSMRDRFRVDQLSFDDDANAGGAGSFKFHDYTRAPQFLSGGFHLTGMLRLLFTSSRGSLVGMAG